MQTSIRTIYVTKSSVNVFVDLIDMKYSSVDIFQNFLDNCTDTAAEILKMCLKINFNISILKQFHRTTSNLKLGNQNL